MAESEKAAAVLRAATETLGSHQIPVSDEILNRALEPYQVSFREENGVYTVKNASKEPYTLEGGSGFVVVSRFEVTGPDSKPRVRSNMKLTWVLQYPRDAGYRAPFGPEASEESAAVAALVFQGESAVALSEELFLMPIPPWIQGGVDFIHDMGRFPPETTLMTLSEAQKRFAEWRLSVEAELGSV